MTIELNSLIDDKPKEVKLKASCRHVAGKVSNAMSLVLLAFLFVLMLLPGASDKHTSNASRVVAVPTKETRQASTVAASKSDVNRTTPVPVLNTRTIPIIEMKVRREVKPLLENSRDQTNANPPTAEAQSPSTGTAAPSTNLELAPTAPSEVQAGPPAPAPPWTETEVSAALRGCLTALAPLNVELETRPPLKDNICGMPVPIAIRRIGPDRVELQPPAVVNCALASALHDWLVRMAQPAARETFGLPIVRLVGISGYACRNRNSTTDGPISEHAFGNALDVSGFVLADGRTISVLKHWGPKSVPPDAAAPSPSPTKRGSRRENPGLNQTKSGLGGPADPQTATAPVAPTSARSLEAVFLRRVHAGACSIFGTVIGPEVNEAHSDHLHFDLKSRRRNGICE